MVQPPRGFGENPVAIYHDPDLPPSHHYLAAYHWLAHGFRGGRRRAPRQARQPGVAARQDAGHVGGLRRRRGAGRPAADLPVPGQRPGRGHPGQTPRPRHPGRPPHPADGPRRNLRRHRATGTAARRARHHRRARPGQAARDPPADLDADAGGQDGPRPRAGRPARRGLVRRHAAARRRLAVRDQGRPDPRRPAHSRPGTRRARPNSTWCWPSCAPASCSAANRPCRACARRSAWPRTAHDDRAAVDAAEASARELVAALQETGWDPAAADALTDDPDVAAILRFAATEVVPRLAGTDRGDRPDPARAGRPVHPRRAVGLAAARSGQRAAHRAQLLLRRPQGGAVAAGVGNRCGDGGFAAGPLPRRLRPLAAIGRAVGVGHLGDAHRGRRHRRSACAAGRSPVGTTRRGGSSTSSRSRWPSWAGRASTSRCGSPGFFRDAFPHVVTMLDDAVRLVAGLDEPAERQLRPRPRRGRPRRARRPTARHHKDFRLQARNLRRGAAAVDRQPQLA